MNWKGKSNETERKIIRRTIYLLHIFESKTNVGAECKIC
jgi:hypothetical protein